MLLSLPTGVTGARGTEHRSHQSDGTTHEPDV